MVKNVKKRCRKVKETTGGSTIGPLDTLNHKDTNQNEKNKHSAEIQEAFNISEKDLQHAEKKLQSKQVLQDNLLIDDNKLKQKNAGLWRTTKYVEGQKNSRQTWNNIGSAIKMFGQFIAYLFKLFGDIFPYIYSLFSGIISTIAKSDPIIGFIIFGLLIILILSIVGIYFINLEKEKKGTENTGGNNGSIEKLNYDVDLSVFDMIANFKFQNVLSIIRLAFGNIIGKYKQVFQDDSKLFIKIREVHNDGRWDNKNNMELGVLSTGFQNVENDNSIYSIRKPKSIKFKVVSKNSLDYSKLPMIIQDQISQDNEFRWTTLKEGNLIKYDLQCNPYDDKNTPLNLFQENGNNCKVIKTPFVSEVNNKSPDPKKYTIPVKREKIAYSQDIFVQ